MTRPTKTIRALGILDHGLSASGNCSHCERPLRDSSYSLGFITAGSESEHVVHKICESCLQYHLGDRIPKTNLKSHSFISVARSKEGK